MPLILPGILAIVYIAGLWKTFEKAGEPGWAAIIPIYNLYMLVKISGRPGWWWVLLIVPVVNIVIAIIVLIDLAKAFGKGVGFALGMLLLGVIFMPILGFGSATYTKPQPAAPPA